MSKAFDEWWDGMVDREEEIVMNRPVCLVDAARAGWNAAITEAADALDLTAADYDCAGVTKSCEVFKQAGAMVRGLAAEEK